MSFKLPIEAWKNPRGEHGFKYPLHCLRCFGQDEVLIILKNNTDGSLITGLCRGCLTEMLELADKTILEELTNET